MKPQWLALMMVACLTTGSVAGCYVGRTAVQRFVISRHLGAVLKIDTATGDAWWQRGSQWMPIVHGAAAQRTWDPFRDSGAISIYDQIDRAAAEARKTKSGFDPNKPFTIEPDNDVSAKKRD